MLEIGDKVRRPWIDGSLDAKEITTPEMLEEYESLETNGRKLDNRGRSEQNKRRGVPEVRGNNRLDNKKNPQT